PALWIARLTEGYFAGDGKSTSAGRKGARDNGWTRKASVARSARGKNQEVSPCLGPKAGYVVLTQQVLKQRGGPALFHTPLKFVAVVAIVLGIAGPAAAAPPPIVVPGDYPTIQAAVDAAKPG